MEQWLVFPVAEWKGEAGVFVVVVAVVAVVAVVVAAVVAAVVAVVVCHGDEDCMVEVARDSIAGILDWIETRHHRRFQRRWEWE